MTLPTTMQPAWQPEGLSLGQWAAAVPAQKFPQGPIRLGSLVLCKKHAAEVSVWTKHESSDAFPDESHETGDVFAQAKSASVADVQLGLLSNARQPRTHDATGPWLGHMAVASLAQSASHPAATTGGMPTGPPEVPAPPKPEPPNGAPVTVRVPLVAVDVPLAPTVPLTAHVP